MLVRFIELTLVKNVINGVNLVKICILWCFLVFFLYFLVKIPIHRLIYTNIVTKPPSFHIFDQNQYFSESSYIPLHNENSGYDAPQDFDGWWHVFLAIVEIYVDLDSAPWRGALQILTKHYFFLGLPPPPQSIYFLLNRGLTMKPIQFLIYFA